MSMSVTNPAKNEAILQGLAFGTEMNRDGMT